MRLLEQLRTDILQSDDQATSSVSTHTLETSREVLKSALSSQEIEVHTLRRQGYTALEICNELEMPFSDYTEIHNDIEEKIHRLYPIETLDIPEDIY